MHLEFITDTDIDRLAEKVNARLLELEPRMLEGGGLRILPAFNWTENIQGGLTFTVVPLVVPDFK